MNRRKYILSTLGIGAGIGLYTKYSTREVIATDIKFENTQIIVPNTQVGKNNNVKINVTEFTLKPINFYDNEKEISIQARTVVPTEYGSTSEWENISENISITEDKKLDIDEIVIPLDISSAEINDAFNVNIEFEFYSQEQKLNFTQQNITISIDEGFIEAPENLSEIYEEMDERDGAKVITNIYELQSMSENLTGDYIIDTDINATDTSEWNDGRGFNPIGNLDNEFDGTLNGNGYKITGLTIDRDRDYVGLIGRTESNCEIENVILENINITGNSNVGGLVGNLSGRAGGSIINSKTTGKIEGGSNTGGLVGYVWHSQVNDSNSECTVDSSGFRVGGLVGRARDSSISNSYATGNIETDEDRAAGLIGQTQDSDILRCYSTGDIEGGEEVGGFIGETDSDVVKNCYSTGFVNSRDTRHYGGFIGWGRYSPTIENCYSIGEIKNSDSNGFIGRTSGSPVDTYWDIESSGELEDGYAEGLTTDEMQANNAEDNMEGFDFDDIWETIDDDYPVLRELDEQTQLDNR